MSLKPLQILFLALLLIPTVARGQSSSGRSYELSMDEAIELAQRNSIASQEYRNIFTASYWTFRAYEASRLPSLNISAGLGQLNHSLVPLQNALTGEINYISNYNLTNNVQLSVNQIIAATGGTVSLYSSLERLDQFNGEPPINWYSQPLTLSYYQPLFTFNQYKWDKLIEPKAYERSKREYIENMERVTVSAVTMFWQYATEQQNYNIAAENFKQSKLLLATSTEKFKLGTVSKTALLQLELEVLNDSIAMSDASIMLISARNALSSFIGLKQDTEIEAEFNFTFPELQLEFGDVLDNAYANSSFALRQEVTELQAEEDVARAKGERGIRVQFDARFGLSNNDPTLAGAYRNLRDQEVVGVTLSMPLYDWGLGEGRVKMAKAQAQTSKNRMEQEVVDLQQDIFVKVMQFNQQVGQCRIAQKAAQIARAAYESATENFLTGGSSMTVTELNSTRTEYDNAQRNYILSVGNFWKYYYEIRQQTLFDYILNIDINARFDEIINGDTGRESNRETLPTGLAPLR